MIKVGITGQSGFLGTHLYNTLGLSTEKFKRIPFEDSYFEDIGKLNSFVSQCDAIVHLAAVNRHKDPEFISQTNIGLVKKLIDALAYSGNCPHVLFSSSIQEDLNNAYGSSKKESRELLTGWAEKNSAVFTGLIFPNIFGPFGKPYYNSFIATFSHQLTHDEHPTVDVNNTIPLIYVSEAVKAIIDAISGKTDKKEFRIRHTAEEKVSDILEILKSFKSFYYDNGIIPVLNNQFEINLLNTFRSFIDIRKHYPVHLKIKADERGFFVETIKTNPGGQLSFSTTKTGITRGNHFHTRKIERFAVIKGEAKIQLRKIGTDEVLNFCLSGERPSYIDMPVWYTHNITNTGNEDLYTLFWVNEFFDPSDTDTYFESV